MMILVYYYHYIEGNYGVIYMCGTTAEQCGVYRHPVKCSRERVYGGYTERICKVTHPRIFYVYSTLNAKINLLPSY